MIYCCGIYHEIGNIIFLKPNANYRDRKLEILACPKCGALIAELTQFDIKEEKYIKIRPKRKKVAKFLMQLEAENKTVPLAGLKIKYGTKSGMNWAYGKNKEHSDGSIYQYRKDFNGISKLVKIIAGS